MSKYFVLCKVLMHRGTLRGTKNAMGVGKREKMAEEEQLLHFRLVVWAKSSSLRVSALLKRVVHELRSEHGDVGGRSVGRSAGGEHVRGQEHKVGLHGLGHLNDLLRLVGERVLDGESQVAGLLVLRRGRHGSELDGFSARGLLRGLARANAAHASSNECKGQESSQDGRSDGHDANHARTAVHNSHVALSIPHLTNLAVCALRLASKDVLANIIS